MGLVRPAGVKARGHGSCLFWLRAREPSGF